LGKNIICPALFFAASVQSRPVLGKKRRRLENRKKQKYAVVKLNIERYSQNWL